MPKYQSLTKEKFGNKSMEGIAQARQEYKLNGKELRQAHFEMGPDIATYEES